jgi:hypothetical protein
MAGDSQQQEEAEAPARLEARPKADVTLWMLFWGMFIAAAMMVVSDRFFGTEREIFQVFADLVSGFAGAFFIYVRPPGGSSGGGGGGKQ